MMVQAQKGIGLGDRRINPYRGGKSDDLTKIAEKYKQDLQERKGLIEEAKLYGDNVQAMIEADRKAEVEMAQESSLKRAGDELEQEKEKKQKIDDDQEEAEMKKLIKVDP
ncbi:hypothetical protein Tco_0960626 [Tanacetum coccineum]